MMGIPLSEKDRVSLRLHHGAANRPPTGIIMTTIHGSIERTSSDGRLRPSGSKDKGKQKRMGGLLRYANREVKIV